MPAATATRILESARQRCSPRTGRTTQIDDVARHAGVGVGTVYRHFPNKEALMVALVREQFRLFADRAHEAVDTLGDDDDAFRRRSKA